MLVTRNGTAILCLTLIYRFRRPRCYSISKIVHFIKWGRTSPGLPYVVVDLLFMSFQLFVEVLCLSLFSMHYIVSFLVLNHLEEEERAGCFVFVVIECLVTVYVLLFFLTVPWVGLQCVIVVFSDHTNLLF